TIAAGASSTTVTVRPIDDGEIESDESATVTDSESAVYNGVSLSNATLTIADNDGPPPLPEKPTVTISATDAQAAEQGPDRGTFTISRAGDASSDLSVIYTLGRTPRYAIDPYPTRFRSTIAAGASSTTVTVRPIDDGEI